MLDSNIQFNKGVSLPEILVVLLILSATLSLVAPLTVDRIEKQQHKQELKQLKTDLNYYQLRAKWSNQPAVISLEGHSFSLVIADKPQYVKKYETLSFQKQSISLYASGSVSSCDILLSSSEKLKGLFAICEKMGSL